MGWDGGCWRGVMKYSPLGMMVLHGTYAKIDLQQAEEMS